MGSYERLSPQDTSFLYMESSAAPMHVGSLAIFEDAGATMGEICDHVESRVHLVPRFRKKLMHVPFGQGRPVWVDDDHFDIRYHVRHTGLAAPGGDTELRALMARLQGIPLDRSRPLWELWVVDMPDGRKALIQKTHHALIDGMSGVDLATVLLDLAPDVDETPKQDWTPEPAPSPLGLLAGSIGQRFTEPVEMLRSVRALTTRPAAGVLASLTESAGGILEFSRAGLEPAPKTSLTRPIGAHRRFEIVRMSLEDVKKIKNETGTSVNDVVLALVAGGLRTLLLARDENVVGLNMRALVPVSVRSDDQRNTFGNQVAAVFVSLPVGEPDARARLAAVAEEMAAVKQSHEVLGAERIMRLADYAPPTLVALASRLMGGVGTQAANLVVTNVPGPQFPLYFRGGQLLEAVPFVPLIAQLSVGVAVLSYNGQLNFGLSGDWDAAPDLPVFAEGIEKSLLGLSD